METTTEEPAAEKPRQMKTKKERTACIVCGKLYCSEFFLQRHLATHKLCPKVKIFMECGYCGTQFYTHETYMAHMEHVVENLRDIKNATKQDTYAEEEPETIVE